MTPDGQQEYRIQLMDAHTEENLTAAGGTVIVCQAGLALKQALTDSAGASLANPITPSRGFMNFFVPTTVASVDLYILAPGGQFVVRKGVVPSGSNEIMIDTAALNHVMVVPIAAADFTAASEVATGFTEPASSLMLPTPFLNVTVVDATETVDIGTDSGDSGNADGYLDGVSVAVAGIIKGTLDNAGATLGALFFVQDSANAGDDAPEGHASGGKAITVTTSAGTDTFQGFLHLPYVLAA